MDGIDRIEISASAMDHIQAYIEYKNIVGDVDGGELLSEEDYAKMREKMMEAAKNRVYVTWRSVDGLDCKNVGPASQCFCGHRWREHTAPRTNKTFPCRVPKCQCKCYSYLPSQGVWRVKCSVCKHDAKLHAPGGQQRCNKCGCNGFDSKFSCSCGRMYDEHSTIFEGREERIAARRPVQEGQTGLMGGLMGAITDYQSLGDGVERQASAGLPLPPKTLGLAPSPKQERGRIGAAPKQVVSTASFQPGQPRPAKRFADVQTRLANLRARPRAAPAAQGIPSSPPAQTTQRGSPAQQTMTRDGSWLDNMTEGDLQNPQLTQAQKYALKKKLAMDRAAALRAERKARQAERERQAEKLKVIRSNEEQVYNEYRERHMDGDSAPPP